MGNKLENYVTCMAVTLFIHFDENYDNDFYQGYLDLVAAVEKGETPEHCTPWEPFEHEQWSVIIELIQEHAFSLLGNVKHITNKIKAGIISETLNGSLDSDANNLDLFELYAIGANTEAS